jgi:hypothetical protein
MDRRFFIKTFAEKDNGSPERFLKDFLDHYGNLWRNTSMVRGGPGILATEAK